MTAEYDSKPQSLPVRILVANISGVLLEIVTRAIQEQPDMTVRHYLQDLAELAVAVGDQTDVLIVGAPFVYPPPTICHNLWLSFPELKVLVMTANGDAAVIYWLSVRQHRLKTVSTTTLADSIRRVHRLDFTAE